MKKTYQKPLTQPYCLKAESMMAQSKTVISVGEDITSGDIESDVRESEDIDEDLWEE